MVIEPQLFIILLGVLIGVIAIIAMPRQQIQKEIDVKDDVPEKQNVVEQLPEGVKNRFEANKQINQLQKEQESIQSQLSQEQYSAEIEIKRLAVQARKDKLLKSLNPSERVALESYFKQKAEEIFQGKQISKDERRFRFAMSALGCGVYVVFFMALLVIIILAFDSSNPQDIIREVELIAFKLMTMLQGYMAQPVNN